MSLLPRRGTCFHCGHNHGEGYGSPQELELIASIAELERQNAELRQQLAASADKTAATVQPYRLLSGMPILTDEMLVQICNARGWSIDDAPPFREVAHAFYAEGFHAERPAAPQPQAARSEDSRDAARYRWLRNESWAGYNTAKGKPQVAESVVLTRDGAGNVKCILAEDAMDQAIDAALAQAGKEQSK
jgi:hypothetical protein